MIRENGRGKAENNGGELRKNDVKREKNYGGGWGGGQVKMGGKQRKLGENGAK